MHQDRLWDEFQNDPALRTTFKAVPRLRRILTMVEKDCRLLNIGVGDGSLERMATERAIEVHSLDPSQSSIARLQAELEMGDRARVGHVEDLPFPDLSFDAVVMSEVLEHLEEEVSRIALTEVRRVLRPGGRFIGTVPADEELLGGQTVCPDCGKVFHRWGHVRSFDAHTLRSELAKEFDAIRITRHYFSDVTRLNWKGRLAWIGKQVLLKSGVKGQGETFLFEACRR